MQQYWLLMNSHNPYFNRWFSAIDVSDNEYGVYEPSQSLF